MKIRMLYFQFNVKLKKKHDVKYSSICEHVRDRLNAYCTHIDENFIRVCNVNIYIGSYYTLHTNKIFNPNTYLKWNEQY